MELTRKLPAASRPGIQTSLRAALKRHPTVRKSLGLPIAIRRAWNERKLNRFNRHFDEVLGNVRSGTLVLNIPNLEGEFETDVRSSTTRRMLRSPAYEPDLVDLIDRFVDRNRDVIDVGANIGLISAYFSKRISPSSRVLAIEPIPDAIRLLRNNLRRNHCLEKIVIFEGMAGQSGGTGEIETIPGMEEYSSALGIHHAKANHVSRHTLTVPVEALDNLVAVHNLSCGFLKIDTEGFELDVLKGAVAVLDTHRPVIFTEASDNLMGPGGRSVRQLVQFLVEHGYHVSDVMSPGKQIIHPFDGELIALPHREVSQ